MKIYGGCIEPEGHELENYTTEHKCTACGGRAATYHWEAAEGGSLNFYFETECQDCDFSDTNH